MDTGIEHNAVINEKIQNNGDINSIINDYNSNSNVISGPILGLFSVRLSHTAFQGKCVFLHESCCLKGVF